MKKIIVLLVIAVACVTSYAQTGNAPVATALIPGIDASSAKSAESEPISVSENEFNFGKIPQGKPVTHIFEVTNKGKDSLAITNVQASCGCTTPVWERDKKIASNASTPITVGYNAAAEGSFNKTVTITYNGTLTKQIIIKGEVWKTPSTSAPENKSINDLKN